MIDRILKWLDHNRYTALGLVAGVLIVTLGCTFQPKATSPLTGKNVTATELNAEIAEFNTAQSNEAEAIVAESQRRLRELQARGEALGPRIEVAYAELEREAELIQGLMSIAQPLVETHLAPLLGVAGITGLLGLFTDNRRKDLVIERKKIERVSTA